MVESKRKRPEGREVRPEAEQPVNANAQGLPSDQGSAEDRPGERPDFSDDELASLESAWDDSEKSVNDEEK